ncbi:MAG TPA: FGGY family carbohydrate kinase [Patescibacteria group bacterium]|nr:FGGY family carbohydrate kinase [Patescibacteria group bacterium]
MKKPGQKILVLDAGTTGVKAFVFDETLSVQVKAYQSIGIDRPKNGWVEQNPQEILSACCRVLKKVVRSAKLSASDIAGLGMTNQRETVVAWDRKTGRSVGPALVWQDRRTAKFCRTLVRKHGDWIRRKTGLPPDPYFSASKIRWILLSLPKAQKLLKEKRLIFGTIDSWLLFHLCKEHQHLTDETNASRTLLCDLHKHAWDPKLLELFGVPAETLPEIRPSSSLFGTMDASLFGFSVPVLAVCGDQQASFVAAARHPTVQNSSHVTKVTYGTGAFLVQGLGKIFKIADPFFTTLVPPESGSRYALEAKVGVCGARVEPYLKNPMRLRQVLRSIARDVHRSLPLLPSPPRFLIIDGGVTRDGLLAEIQSEISSLPVISQTIFDGTALGTAMLVQEAWKKLN